MLILHKANHVLRDVCFIHFIVIILKSIEFSRVGGLWVVSMTLRSESTMLATEFDS